MTKLAEFLVSEGVVEDISHEGLRKLLDADGVSFQRIKTWKESTDPEFETQKNRVLELYEIADGKRDPAPGDPSEVICLDEFGPLNLQPRPGRQWARRSRRHRGDEHGSDTEPRRRMRATFHRTQGVKHLFAAFDLKANSSTATSSHASAAASSSRSCATSARCTPRRCGSRSCLTTSHRTSAPSSTSASASTPPRTTSNWRTPRQTRAG